MRQLLFKVFAWFWSSIAVTIVILLLITSFSFTEVVYKPLSAGQAKTLKKYAMYIQKRFDAPPSSWQLKRMLHRSNKQRVLVLKGPTPEMSVVSANLPEKIDLNLLNEIDELPPQHIFTEYFHASGPVRLTLQNQTFHLYEITAKRHPPLMIKFSLMPLWLKLSVPILVSLALSFLFARSIVRPIRALSKTADAIGQGHLQSRVPKKFVRNDELGELVTDFNAMAEQLSVSIDGQKRLLADISHELRSPLTRLSLAAAMAKDPKVSEEKKQAYLERIEKEAHQLDDMIGSVLMLSRLETDQQHMEKRPHPLADILTPLIQDAEFEAESQNKVIIVEDLPNVVITVDAHLLSSAIENILRNAIRYAEKQIDIAVKRSINNELEIMIQDDGQGVDESTLEKITEPFYRHSDARERESGGAGLGLAIAKKALLAHGGDLYLANQPEGGLIATLKLKI